MSASTASVRSFLAHCSGRVVEERLRRTQLQAAAGKAGPAAASGGDCPLEPPTETYRNPDADRHASDTRTKLTMVHQ
jgi:hypothetical protein